MNKIDKFLNEDYLICKGERIKDFYEEIKHMIHDYEFKGDTLKFMISGDQETVDRFTNIGRKYDVIVKFEA